MGCGWDGRMMEWVSSITEIIRDWKLSFTLTPSKQETLTVSFSAQADGTQVSVSWLSSKN